MCVLLKMGSYDNIFLSALLFSLETSQLKVGCIPTTLNRAFMLVGLLSVGALRAWVEQVLTLSLPEIQGTTNISLLYFVHYCILFKCTYCYIIHIEYYKLCFIVSQNTQVM